MSNSAGGNYAFLFSELVKRDFKKKYKSTYLGMLWSLASPLLTLFIMSILFTHFFGTATAHYTIYLFCGNICFSFFSDLTSGAMGALLANSEIFSKIKLPKQIFIFSRAVTSLINFAMTFAVFMIFCALDGIAIGPHFLALFLPVLELSVFSIGMGLILSSLFVFFRDMQYLWSVITMLLMYLSAIFYTVEAFPPAARRLFYLNPLYVYISSFRSIVISSAPPDAATVVLGTLYALLAFGGGMLIIKQCNNKFIYYV